MIACPDCDKTCKDAHGLAVHRHSHKQAERPTCPVCGRTFGHGGALAAHTRPGTCSTKRPPKRRASPTSEVTDPRQAGTPAGRAELDALLGRIEENERTVEGYDELVEAGGRQREARSGTRLRGEVPAA